MQSLRRNISRNVSRKNVILGGKSLRSYWNPSNAVVQDADPTKVILTYAKKVKSADIVTTNFSITGKTIDSATLDATGKIVTLTVTVGFAYGDVIVVVANSTNIAVNNNVLYYMTLTKGGDGTGVSTINMESSQSVILTLTGTARFYSNAEGTADESTTWELLPGAERSRYIRCPDDAPLLKFSDITKIIRWGNSVSGWQSPGNSPRITANLNHLSEAISLRTGQLCTLTGIPPKLRTIYIGSNPVTWTYTGKLPDTMTDIYMNGNNLDWIGLSVGNDGNITRLELNNYRAAKMSSADMVTLLTQLTNRTGSLPSTITINDYADYASPPQSVTDAVEALKLAKSVTTVTLGA